MKTILLCLVTLALLVSACSSSPPAGTETPVVRVEAQATTNGDESIGESATAVNDTSAVEEASTANQPPKAIEEATAVAEAPQVEKPAATDTPYPTYTPSSTVAPASAEAVEETSPEASREELTAIGTAAVETATTTEAPPTTPIPTTLEMAEDNKDGETVSEPAIESTTQPAGESAAAPAAQSVALTRIADTDPGPPFTILVSDVRIEENGTYKVTGTVRNDGSEVYGGIGVVATFFTELECGERYVQSRAGPGQPPSGSVENVCDPNWFGPVKAYAACQLLAPGAECPFSLQIYGRDYVSYHLHPEGTPVEYRQPASLTLSGVNVYDNGLGYVRVTGTATNDNPFAVRDANVAGTLINANEQIASVGSVLVPGEIAPGASLDFDLRIEYEPYANYQLYAQATQA